MIPDPYITQWATRAPWPHEGQIEQDMILSRLILEIAADELLGKELAFRGGTCLHKLHLPQAQRYSEDLDYTRTSQLPKLGECLTALRAIATDIGLRESRRRFPSRDSDMACIWFHADSQAANRRIAIKIEINVKESAPYRPHVFVPFDVESPWWSGSAQVRTFAPEELLATKLRALYARRKGRDLFDLWLALTELTLDDQLIIASLTHYMGEDAYSYRQLHSNLQRKLASREFLDDITELARNTGAYEPREAAELLMHRLGMRLRNATTEAPARHFPSTDS